MKTTRFKTLCLAVFLLAVLLTAGAAVPLSAAEEITISTGSVTGVYYQAGQAIKKIVDRNTQKHGFTCTVNEAEGSIFNLNSVLSGKQNFGIVQSDIQFLAWNGSAGSPWAGQPQKNLRVVFSLYTEAVSLLAAADANINSLKDLKGKRVNLGESKSGQYINSTGLLSAAGIDISSDLREAVTVSMVSSLDLFKNGKIEAFFFTVGHPVIQFKEIAHGKRKAGFVPITETAPLIQHYPYYVQTKIPISFYPGLVNSEDVETIGVKATLITSTEVPDTVVYTITREICENLPRFKKLMVVLSTLTPETMMEGMTAPIHPGALKYYREAGMPLPAQ